DQWRLEGIAHDTGDIIARIRNCDAIEEALDGVVRVAGFTARRRAAKRDITTPHLASRELLEFATSGPVAVLLGREDKGLPNDILDRAHLVVTIPTTNHASLNLAQAVLIALYELHLTAADATRTLAPPRTRESSHFCARSLSKSFGQSSASLGVRQEACSSDRHLAPHYLSEHFS